MYRRDERQREIGTLRTGLFLSACESGTRSSHRKVICSRSACAQQAGHDWFKSSNEAFDRTEQPGRAIVCAADRGRHIWQRKFLYQHLSSARSFNMERQDGYSHPGHRGSDDMRYCSLKIKKILRGEALCTSKYMYLSYPRAASEARTKVSRQNSHFCAVNGSLKLRMSSLRSLRQKTAERDWGSSGYLI